MDDIENIKPEDDNEILVYVLTERGAEYIDIEVVRGSGEYTRVDTVVVEDMEPDDVWGPIFSRVFDNLGITLDDPGDFSWKDVPLEPLAFLITINCSFTTED